MPNLDPKGKGNNSMAENQRSRSGVWSGALRDLRDTVKAELPEAQSPEDARSRPPEKRLKPAPHPVLVSRPYRDNFQSVERCPVRAFKEMNESPKSRYSV
jgi:hypothetical protein